MGKMVISILMCQFHAAGQHIHEALVREHVEREKCGFWGVQWSNFPLSRLKTTGIHTGNSPWHAGVSLMFVSVYRWNKQIKQEIASQCVCENCQKARADDRSKCVFTPPLPSFREVDGPTGANACSLHLPPSERLMAQTGQNITLRARVHQCPWARTAGWGPLP